MIDNGLFSVGRFAQLSRTTPATLHHYEKIGLLTPISRGENNYRYYSHRQMSYINMIRILQTGGTPLSEIKRLSTERTPEYMDEVLECQIRRSAAIIEDEMRAQKLLSTLQTTIRSALHVDERAITIQSLPEAPIILGDPNDYSGGKNPFDALAAFYAAVSGKFPELDLNYPVWGLFEKERIGQWRFGFPDRFYFFNPEGCDMRPKARYAVGYMRGTYGQSGELFQRLLDYIHKNDFEICGNAYEEYPLNELCIVNDRQYLIRLLIAVREKQSENI